MPTNPIDLTTVAAVQSYLTLPGASGTGPDPTSALIQGLITSASQYWLWRTGQGSLSQVVAYNEWYDGNGQNRLFLRNQPVTAITTISINGVPVAASNGYGIPGVMIHQDGKSLVIRPGGGSSVTTSTFLAGGQIFERGMQNINAQYSAGYASTPPDVADKATQMVAVNFKRRGWIDQASQMLSQAGTISYQKWEIPPEVERTIRNYTRVAVI